MPRTAASVWHVFRLQLIFHRVFQESDHPQAKQRGCDKAEQRESEEQIFAAVGDFSFRSLHFFQASERAPGGRSITFLPESEASSPVEADGIPPHAIGLAAVRRAVQDLRVCFSRLPGKRTRSCW